MTLNSLFVIRSDADAELYWNNATGYADLASADAFTEKEAQRYNLPIEGEWVRLDKAIDPRIR
jgi:hypothetical protein